MKHISKIDGRTYEISHSASYKDGRWYNDDITLVWTETQDKDKFTRLANFYYGEYDYNTTEQYIKDYLNAKKDGRDVLKIMTVKEKANEIVKYLYEETKKYATSSTHIVTFDEINNKFGVDMSNKFWQDTVHEESYTNHMDDIRTIDIDNVKQYIVVMMWKTNKPKTVELPLCYVNLIDSCLRTIQKHDLIGLVYGSYADEEDLEAEKDHLDEVINNFCKPIIEVECIDDITIDMYE